jgi:PAS domain S-box-containing protein
MPCCIDLSPVNSACRYQQQVAGRVRILDAIAGCAGELLAGGNWKSGIRLVLQRLGMAAGVDRVYLWKREEAAGALRRRHQWAVAGAPEDGRAAALGLGDQGLRPWLEGLAAGHPVWGEGAGFPSAQGAWLACGGVQGVALLPVWAGERWWGVLEFDACGSGHSWHPLEIDALVAASDLLGQAIQRRRTERRLHELSRRQRILLDNLGVGVAYVREGRFVQVNRRMSELFGWSEEAFGGISPSALHRSPEHYAQTEGAVQALGEGELCRCEQELIRKDGQPLWVRIVVQAVHRRHPAKGVIWVVDDIRREKEAQRLLHQAKEAAETAARMKSEFLANMSHEIRTPLNAVLGLTQLCLESGSPEERQGHLHKIRRAAETLLQLLNGLLDYSKLEAGRLQIDAIPFAPRELCAQVEEMMGELARQKGVQLQVEVAPELPARLEGDALRLGQVLTNLVSNAIKFTAQGWVRLEVRRLGGRAGRCALEFAVSDSGIGIDPADRHKLFQAFSQVDGSITRRYGGTGLGLAICKQLVGLMGGEIGVESLPGRGSRFHFTLELPEAAAVAPQRGLRGARVLLVEDDEINQLIARELLGRQGIRVDVAGDGQTALERVSSGHYDCVLMDIQMPEMDGFQATRLIRRLPQGRGLPILALTADAPVEGRESYRAAGLDDYIPKPITPERLLSTLERWLRQPPILTGQEGVPPFRLPAPAVRGGRLDQRSALARLGGRTELYHHLLELFRRNYADKPVLIRQALARGDREGVRYHLHALQEVAGTLGAEWLRVIAQELEHAQRHQLPQARLEELLRECEQELAELCREIDGLIAKGGQPERVPTEGGQGVPRLLQELRRKLRHSQVDAGETLEQLLSRVEEPELRRRLIAIRQPIHRLDYPLAMDTLEQMVCVGE